MTFVAADPIPSGRPYPVTDVGGSAPTALQEFVGSVEFGLDTGSKNMRVCGSGVVLADGVRFHEKDVAHNGKDVRVWLITASSDRGFTAATDAGYGHNALA